VAFAGCFEVRSSTSSMATMAPRPRTSPMTSNRSAISDSRVVMIWPILIARSSKPSRSI